MLWPTAGVAIRICTLQKFLLIVPVVIGMYTWDSSVPIASNAIPPWGGTFKKISFNYMPKKDSP